MPLREERRRSNVVTMNAITPLREAPVGASDDALAWLEKERGIDRQLALRMGVVSGSKHIRKLNDERPCVGFTYYNEGQAYAVKWRAYPEKGFTQDGAAQTLYLAEHVPDGSDLVITEGEVDALSFWMLGIPAVSIPSGGIEAGTADDNAKLRWTRHHDGLLKNAKRIFIASDGDVIGESTAQELARRLGKARCWRIAYPEGTKDANDVLMRDGPSALKKLVEDAKPWPVEGVATVADLSERVLNLYNEGLPPGHSTGWAEIDKLFTVAQGNLTVVTGIPSSGKSTWLDNLLVNMMRRHDSRVAWASFENPPEIHIAKLLTQYRQKPFGKGRTERMTPAEVKEALAWLNERAVFLEHEEMLSPEEITDRFDACVRRFGTKIVVVDPFNFVKLGGQDGPDTESINRMLSHFKIFAKSREVAFFIVAHPAKPIGQGSDWVPTGYSISGSAHFYNRADFGLTLHRKDTHTEFHVWKARFAHQGTQGSTNLVYDPISYTYEEQREPVAPSWMNDDDF